MKVGICTNSGLFLALFKYTIVDPEIYDFSSNSILIITISHLLSHLSKKAIERQPGMCGASLAELPFTTPSREDHSHVRSLPLSQAFSF